MSTHIEFDTYERDMGFKRASKTPRKEHRVAEFSPPTPIAMAVKRALGLPIYVLVRTPVGKKDWVVTKERIA